MGWGRAQRVCMVGVLGDSAFLGVCEVLSGGGSWVVTSSLSRWCLLCQLPGQEGWHRAGGESGLKPPTAASGRKPLWGQLVGLGRWGPAARNHPACPRAAVTPSHVEGFEGCKTHVPHILLNGYFEMPTCSCDCTNSLRWRAPPQGPHGGRAWNQGCHTAGSQGKPSEAAGTLEPWGVRPSHTCGSFVFAFAKTVLF